MALSTVSCVAPEPGKINAGNFQSNACFGYVQYKLPVQDKNKPLNKNMVIQYLCAPKTTKDSDYEENHLSVSGYEFPRPLHVLPEGKQIHKNTLTKEETDLWIDLLRKSGFKFHILLNEVVNGVPVYVFEVHSEEHMNYWGLTLGTLTALRYINEAPDCVRSAAILVKKFPNHSSWDILQAALRCTVKDVLNIDHGSKVSGHSLIYSFGVTYPSCYAECVDSFLNSVVKKVESWKVQSSFTYSGTIYHYMDVKTIKDIKEGTIHV